jgi:hypothetical protein
MGDFLMNEGSDKSNPDEAKNNQSGFSLGYGYVGVNAKYALEKARGKV